MIRAREYVESMKDRKIKFLYITSEADSPLGAYQKFLDEYQIKGEHLRITKEQWNLLTSKFDIQGIPHCVIVNKARWLITIQDVSGTCQVVWRRSIN